MKRAFLLVAPVLLALLILVGVLEAASMAASPFKATLPPAPASPESQPPSPTADSASDPILPQEVSTRIHPLLLKALLESRPEDRLKVIVQWRRDPNLVQNAASGGMDRTARGQAVVQALKTDQQQSTRGLHILIDGYLSNGQAEDVRYFWASPIIALSASPELVRELAERSEVFQIRFDNQIWLEDSITPEEMFLSEDLLPNLEMIQAGLAGEVLGLDGSGVVVANLDTGVDWQHPALKIHYRGYNPNGPGFHYGNWHVSTDESYLYPGDGNSHGTHTMGTLVGDDGLGHRTGAAPGASWIAVKVFTNEGYTFESWIHDAFEWILAPEGDPALAPNVVNNSWSSRNSSDETYAPDIEALIAAGIIPVFSAGNTGPGVGSVGSPGSLPGIFSVGALDYDKRVASFSSRGPSPWDEIKPEVSAPGVQVLSTIPGGGYGRGSGTSMSAPHIAGTIALLLQANPDLSYAEVVGILKSTAEPLGTAHPNNNTGWGLINAYAAGLAVTGGGEISGTVRSEGLPVPHPTITATLHSGSPSIVFAGDEAGAFWLALEPGLYDMTAGAFGFQESTQAGILVHEGDQIEVDFVLTRAPSGVVHGRVTDLKTGAPISATLTIPDTPVRVQTNANTGSYSLTLPEGTWTLEVLARAYRIRSVTVSIEPDDAVSLDIPLQPAPSILLVDSGRWYYESEIAYYQGALHSLSYSYDLHPIRNINDPLYPDDRPISTTLLAYDIVIWSAPFDSPGLVGSGPALRDYLNGGGHLLVSGEDVAYWDAGGAFQNPSTYLVQQTSVWFDGQTPENVEYGASGSPLEGLELLLNTPDSAGLSTFPDTAAVRSSILAAPALFQPDGSVTSITAGTCTPYRSAWLGFGLENAGPGTVRAEALGRLIDWFGAEPEPLGLNLQAAEESIISRPGTTITWTLTLQSTGIETDSVRLEMTGSPFTYTVAYPGGSFQGSQDINLGGCMTMPLTATLTIPAESLRDTAGVYTFTATSLSNPSITVSESLSAKTPAPILVVDVQNWYPNRSDYTTALDQMGLRYDIFDAYNMPTVPETYTLQSYPMVLWITGYNWAWPLDDIREQRLEAYLDGGGRLLMSSQDAIDVTGIDYFFQERLGVADAVLSVKSEAVLPIPGSLYGSQEGVWELNYPFTNWSDGLKPGHDAVPVLQDARGNVTGLLHDNSPWRTAFYALPLETLPADAMRAVLGNSLLWISPVGDSKLDAPPAAAAGSEITITLNLRLAGADEGDGYQAVLQIPEGVSVVPGSLTGEWWYDPEQDALEWIGDLCSTCLDVMTARLAVDPSLPAGTIIPLQAQLSDRLGKLAVAEQAVRIGTPWPVLRAEVTPQEVGIGEVVTYTIRLDNLGPVADAVTITQVITEGLDVLTDTLSSNLGTPVLSEGHLSWSGELPSGFQLAITYRAQTALPVGGARLESPVEVFGLYDHRVAPVVLEVIERIFLPFLKR